MHPAPLPLSLRPARPGEAERVVALVNSAYRGESSRQGWTTEADILGGQRTDLEEIEGLMDLPDSLILLVEQDGELFGSLHLQREGEDAAYLGMLTVRPGLQGEGWGRRMMAAAEEWAARTWGSRRMLMSVIMVRSELIAYYERRGYRRTGETKPIPTSPRFGLPKLPALWLEILEKPLTAPPGAAAPSLEGP